MGCEPTASGCDDKSRGETIESNVTQDGLGHPSVAHFVVTWLFIMFLMIHVYLTIREKFAEIKEMHLLSEAEETEENKKTIKEPAVD